MSSACHVLLMERGSSKMDASHVFNDKLLTRRCRTGILSNSVRVIHLQKQVSILELKWSRKV